MSILYKRPCNTHSSRAGQRSSVKGTIILDLEGTGRAPLPLSGRVKSVAMASPVSMATVLHCTRRACDSSVTCGYPFHSNTYLFLIFSVVAYVKLPNLTAINPLFTDLEETRGQKETLWNNLESQD